ncbi:YD repeat-containing protein [Gramella sp. Hel_I_59]|uniref:hypothetical protein n=1 Tax=Gramella sp. Hel_I_59 TaxID=1249978 RepID=UPI001153624E|nr:hypothetical protein [Gramella sp. Hel_I_59]TQI72142.1 YD repeat-containing protein [Gramella sp. Hel_I_59]
MKLRYLLFVFSVVLFSCSSDDSSNVEEGNPAITGDFVGYTQTFNQSGDVYDYTYEDGKWLSMEVNGDLWIELQYNDEDQLVRITENSQNFSTDLQFGYDESGQLISVQEYDESTDSFMPREITYSGDVIKVDKLSTGDNSGRVVFTFDNDQLSKFEDFNGDSMLLHSDELEYDEGGNVIQNTIFTSYSGLSITEVFGYEYDDKPNPLAGFFQNYTLPFLIYGSKAKLVNYEISTAIRAFGTNNRITNIYPASYSENQKLDIEVDYNGEQITTQTFIFRPQEAVIQVIEFLYSE